MSAICTAVDRETAVEATGTCLEGSSTLALGSAGSAV
jgi:hypothetical protein